MVLNFCSRAFSRRLISFLHMHTNHLQRLTLAALVGMRREPSIYLVEAGVDEAHGALGGAHGPIGGIFR